MKQECVVPVPGMPAYYTIGSDAYPYTVIEVAANGKRVVLQADRIYRADTNGPYSESQTYLFAPDPDGTVVAVSFRKTGRWVEIGRKPGCGFFTLGKRAAYRDPSF